MSGAIAASASVRQAAVLMSKRRSGILVEAPGRPCVGILWLLRHSNPFHRRTLTLTPTLGLSLALGLSLTLCLSLTLSPQA